jgi:hypothetical protein
VDKKKTSVAKYFTLYRNPIGPEKLRKAKEERCSGL